MDRHHSGWEGLQHYKSLFRLLEGCSLPMGNLTSLLFSNVYIEVQYRYKKCELLCCHFFCCVYIILFNFAAAFVIEAHPYGETSDTWHNSAYQCVIGGG